MIGTSAAVAVAVAVPKMAETMETTTME